MILAIWIGVYILGGVLNYLFTRHCYKGVFKEWTVGDRRFFLLMSIGSFISLVAAFFTILPDYLASISKDSSKNSSKPAKW